MNRRISMMLVCLALVAGLGGAAEANPGIRPLHSRRGALDEHAPYARVESDRRLREVVRENERLRRQLRDAEWRLEGLERRHERARERALILTRSRRTGGGC
ncbi:MAG: hypothetical protein HC923_06320 [Myxococcales bacterium]|nr:hypothetical protein [Myxococcales bacterium]